MSQAASDGKGSYLPLVPRLEACPFCRQLFEAGEVSTCPECDLRLADPSDLPPSADALAIDPTPPLPPHLQPLPWTYLGRGRALLLGLAVLGLLAFFAPWVHETAPELRDLSGFHLARRLHWMWAPAIAFFVLIPLVLTRRSIHRMRGARLSIAMLATIALLTVALRVAFTPATSSLRPVRFTWGAGLYATATIALAALAASARFGGRLDPLPASTPPVDTPPRAA
ncbi:hypothetical protein [Chondromyces crocatus]|uniref:Uncharacterized protein n=1 Tax=Chondromyces crocatus TaxID=52 RepID=A0A0K1EN55_CHOCO|nr:hypothetical protein [Chondromyces crocatus]AKT42289.1 uncharacterized protein CMC5_065120 [Chondromyces crocatus]